MVLITGGTGFLGSYIIRELVEGGRQVRAIKRSKEPSTAGKVALILLSVIVAMTLVVGLVFLSCAISCNGGSGALSWIVLLGGTALIVFLLVVVIRRILGVKKKKIKDPQLKARE